MITGFQAASGCQVALRPWSGAADAPGPLRGMLGTLDLVSVRADRVRALVGAHLLVPVDNGAIDGIDGAGSRLRSQPAIAFGGATYAVPYAWEPLLLLSRDDAFPDGPPTGLRALWEPRRSAQVAVPDDPLTLATAALSVGVDDPFDLDLSDLAAADELVRLAAPAYRWRGDASLERLLASGQVSLALGPPRIARDLQGRVDVSVTMPVEGAVGVARVLAIPVRAPHPVCAYRFLSYVLEPQAQAAVALATGLTPVVRTACRALGTRQCTRLHANDQWSPRVQLAHRPVAPAAPWARWVAGWRASRRERSN